MHPHSVRVRPLNRRVCVGVHAQTPSTFLLGLFHSWKPFDSFIYAWSLVTFARITENTSVGVQGL